MQERRAKQDRADRLAAALRENLRRRKAQARDVRPASTPDADEPVDEPSV